MKDVVSAREPDRPISYHDVLDAIEKLEEMGPSSHPLYFYCPGNGELDKIAIDYWSRDWVIVVDTNGDHWLHGAKIDREDL